MKFIDVIFPFLWFLAGVIGLFVGIKIYNWIFLNKKNTKMSTPINKNNQTEDKTNK